MKITTEQYALIEPCLPRQRGNVRLANIDVINAVLWLAEHDCKWIALPPSFGNAHSIYMRVRRWSKMGVLDRVFEQMQRLGLLRLRLEVMSQPPTEAVWAKPVSRTPWQYRDSAMSLKFTWVPRMGVTEQREGTR